MNEEELLTAIKSIASDGADLSAITTGLTAYGVKPIDSVLDRETALKYIEGNSHLQSALDSRITTAVDKNKSKFNTDELPSLKTTIRQELLKELNPEMTGEQKLQEQIDQMKAEGLNKIKVEGIEKELLRTFDTLKASDLGFKVEDLAQFVPLGETAVESFAKLHGRFADILKTSNEEVLKGRMNTGNPPAGDPETPLFKNPLEGQTWMDK